LGSKSIGSKILRKRNYIFNFIHRSKKSKPFERMEQKEALLTLANVSFMRGDVMKGQEVIVELLNGRWERGTLSHPFEPNMNNIDLKLSGNGESITYAMSDVCCIHMVPETKLIPTFRDGSWVPKEITTVADTTYHAYIIGKGHCETGFYAYNANSNGQGELKLIFFNFLGVKSPDTDEINKIILQQEQSAPNVTTNEITHEEQDDSNRNTSNNTAEVVSPDNIADKNYANGDGVLSRQKIGEILIESNLITVEQLEAALSVQKRSRSRKKLGEILLDKDLISEEQLLKALAQKFQLTFVDLDNIVPSAEALNSLPGYLVHNMQVFPIDINDNHILIATSKPNDLQVEDVLKFYTKRNVKLVVASSRQISEAIASHYRLNNKNSKKFDQIISEMTSDSDTIIEEELEEENADQFSEADSHIITLVNKILKEAYYEGASDIHIEPGIKREPTQIRYRIDGNCKTAHRILSTYKHGIVSRIKVLSRLDISERRRPQSGKMALRHGNQKVEYRVEVTPTTAGNEDVVLRILPSSQKFSLDDLGFTENNFKSFKNIISKPYGIFLCVGPTGSGKTTTLHAALAYLNTPERKIWTAEDPVEITQRGLRQVQVNYKIGFTFSEALRSFLRSDPDIIMIGEMRDVETAKIAIEASLTGHLVLSTLHTNSAPETLIRLIEMGMEPFNFADAILGVNAQRLALRLCDNCKEEYHPDIKEYESVVKAYDPYWFSQHHLPPYSEDLTLMRKKGCEKCYGTGYRKRIALHELMPATRSIKKAIVDNIPANELRDLAISEGMRTLRMDGIQKVFQGLTDLEQVCRVTF
jgi:type II secretory ATPase GspE/PulE/Tfp pilus assembly ATPase PilB-like protein